MSNIAALNVYLNNYLVGVLTQLPNDRIIFNFDEKYEADPNHPILSQSFYDKFQQLIDNPRPTQTKAPAFFTNLLPEGNLREYLANKAGINPARDFGILQLLGRDLPGAVVVEAQVGKDLAVGENAKILEQDFKDEKILKFSLAGVQLKFSALMEVQGGLTIPAHGIGGDWIIKLPSFHFQYVPENEYAMLELAKHIGIEVPEKKLINLKFIHGLPDIATQLTGNALAVKRFDRLKNKRIHIEDFSQVYNVYPHKKYESASYNNIVGMIAAVAGEATAQEFVKRLIFNTLIGNGDMHLKNWSFIYQDGRTMGLAPAYDYVATAVYINDTRLALNLSGEKEMLKINIDLIKHFAAKSGLSEKMVIHTVQDTMEKTFAAWRELKSGLPLTKKMLLAIDSHMTSVINNLQP